MCNKKFSLKITLLTQLIRHLQCTQTDYSQIWGLLSSAKSTNKN